MTSIQKFARLIVTMQAVLFGVLLLIIFLVLPYLGFKPLEDFNNPTQLAAFPFLMALLNWIHVIFGVTMLGVVYVLFQQPRWPHVLRSAIGVILIGVILWFIVCK